MAVVVKIPHQRHIAAHAIQQLAYARHLRRCFRRIHSNAHQLRTRLGQLKYLLCRTSGIRRVSIGHGLHHYRRIATDGDLAHHDTLRNTARYD